MTDQLTAEKCREIVALPPLFEYIASHELREKCMEFVRAAGGGRSWNTLRRDAEKFLGLYRSERKRAVKNCGNCFFFVPLTEVHDVGACRKNAPVHGGKKQGLPNVAGEYSLYFDTNRSWPQTEKSDWCGQWEKRGL